MPIANVIAVAVAQAIVDVAPKGTITPPAVAQGNPRGPKADPSVIIVTMPDGTVLSTYTHPSTYRQVASRTPKRPHVRRRS